MKPMQTTAMLLCSFVLLAPLRAGAWTTQPSGHDEWGNFVDEFIVEVKDQMVSSDVDARSQGKPDEKTVHAALQSVDRLSTSRQTESSALADNSTSLLNRGSAADLLGVALNLAGLSGDFSSGPDEGQANSVAVTSSAYALYSAVTAENPNDPTRYCSDSGRRARKVMFSAGYDSMNDEASAGAEDVSHATNLGLKFLLVNGRDACSFQIDGKAIYDAGQADIALRNSVRDEACRQLGIGLSGDACEDALEDDAQWARFRTQAAAWDLDALAEVVRQQSDAFRKFHNMVASAIEKVRKGNQVALDLGVRLEEGEITTNVYSAMLVWELGGNGSWSFVGNLGGQYDERDKDMGVTMDVDSGYSGVVGAQLEYKFSREKLGFLGSLGNRGNASANGDDIPGLDGLPVRWVTAVKAEWKSEVEDVYSVQTKVVIPVADGIDFPISVTYASSSEIIEEDEVRGQVGFTLDTSRLLDLF